MIYSVIRVTIIRRVPIVLIIQSNRISSSNIIRTEQRSANAFWACVSATDNVLNNHRFKKKKKKNYP